MSLSKLDGEYGVNVPLCKCSLKCKKEMKKKGNDEPDSEVCKEAASEILDKYKG